MCRAEAETVRTWRSEGSGMMARTEGCGDEGEEEEEVGRT